MNIRKDKIGKNRKIFDDVEKLHNQFKLIAEKNENQLKKQSQDFIKIRLIIYPIIFSSVLIFFIMFFFKVFYFLLIIELVTTIFYVVYGVILETNYRKRRLTLSFLYKKFKSKKFKTINSKGYPYLYFLITIFTFLAILLISIIITYLLLVLIIIVISLIFLYFTKVKE